MAKGSPPLQDALLFSRRYTMFPRGGRVLCAVSGGRDSVALLHLLRAWAGQEGFFLEAAHFNHHLRPTADRDEAFVRELCKTWEIPLVCGDGDVWAAAKEGGRGVEDAARVLRYGFLEDAANRRGCARIVTAHHREDNAETVLLNLLRGTGAQGLGGIPPVRGNIVRPLLETGRAAINAYIALYNLPYQEDETNQDTAYTRNRIRLEALPLLESISPGCTARIAAAAGIMREENGILDRAAQSMLLPERQEGIPIAALRDVEPAIGRRAVRLLARRFGLVLTAAQTQAVMVLPVWGSVRLPDGFRAVKTRQALRLERTSSPPPPLVLCEGRQNWGAYTLELTKVTAGGAHDTVPDMSNMLDMPSIPDIPDMPGVPNMSDMPDMQLRREGITAPLILQAWDGRGRLDVENGSRSIKRVLTDKGIPPYAQEGWPILYLEGKPAAVLGGTVARALRPRPGEAAWRICWRLNS